MKTAKLNKSQIRAVSSIKGPCLVIAGPGSGKTRVIAHRIIKMVEEENIPPTRILAISFTKASSIDMRKRTLGFSNDDRIKKVSFATFHSAFFRIIKKFIGVRIEDLISEADRFKLVKSIVRHLKIENCSDDDISEILSDISYIKNDMQNYKNFESEYLKKEEIERVFSLYESEKKRLGKIDFDDMLLITYKLLKENSEVLDIVRQVYKYILIDEFQDINRVQFETIRLIAYPNNNVFAVGDEDQSIYGFRGARPDFMMDFERYFKGCKKIVLDTNYRSKKNIVDVSQKLIKNNSERYDKNIEAFSKDDGYIKFIYPHDNSEEADIVSNEILDIVKKKELEYDDFAVIYRNNNQARVFVDSFMEKRIPFVLKDNVKTIYDHWVSVDILSYLRASLDIATGDEWIRIINKPYRYISKESIKRASRAENFLESLLEDENIKPYTKRTLRDLYEDLRYIRGLAPEYGISYIRSTLDYDRYILEYCHDRKIKAKQIVDILDELESSSKQFRNIFDFFSHIEKVKEEVKNNASKNFNIEEKGVVLSTMHSAKGLEFKNVYVVGVVDGIIPYRDSLDDDYEGDLDEHKTANREKVNKKEHFNLPEKNTSTSDNSTLSDGDEQKNIKKITKDGNCENFEEERRLMYVAITRAKERLVISSPKKRFKKNAKPSIFVEEIQKGIKNISV